MIPLLLLCFFLAIENGISLHQEIKESVEAYQEKVPVDMVAAMYRKELVKELFGEMYED